MVSRSILAVAAAAIGLLGAEASPCRPTTVTSLSESATSSVGVSMSEATTLTTSIEATPTTVAETTSTILDEVTPTTLAASTTTSEAPACVETQLIYNSGFDGNDELSPWMGDGQVIKSGVYSTPNALALKFYSGGGTAAIAQNLPTLEGGYLLSYRWAVPSAVNPGEGFSCTINPTIGGNMVGTLYPYELSGWAPETRPWSSGSNPVTRAALVFNLECSGEYDELTITLDDITLTRVCGGVSG